MTARVLTIVDNADGQVNLLVYRSASGEEVCKEPVLPPGDGGSLSGSSDSSGGSGGSLSGSVSGSVGSGSGSEKLPIGVGNSVFVASTYGYRTRRSPPARVKRCPPRRRSAAE